ncbi:class I SAM-dependent methyltransferase [Patescibacteria group bacterium]
MADKISSHKMQTLFRLPQYYKTIINHLVNTESEVQMLEKIFLHHQIVSVLDIACGVGRHAILLAKKRYYITAVDYSQPQIDQARKDAKKERAAVKFLKKDVNNFVSQKKYDAAICMWTTIGEEPLQYRRVIRNVYKSLKRNGIFVIDNRSWEYIPKKGKEIITNKVTQNQIQVKSRLHDRYTQNFRVRNAEYTIKGKKYHDLCITHLLKEQDWLEQLKEAGFTRFTIWHDREKKRLKRPKHVTIVAQK